MLLLTVTQLWYLFKGDFSGDATNLRKQFECTIETKRQANVIVALPDSVQNMAGLLYATLPTQHETGLPFHINADFFPYSDRKRVLFEKDYQSQWNKAAIRAAAKVIADNLQNLRDHLGHCSLWELLAEIKKIFQETKIEVFQEFWRVIKPRMNQIPLVWTSRQDWRKAEDVFLLQAKEEEETLPVLEAAGLSLVHPDLRSYYSLLQEAVVRLLNASELADALSRSGLKNSIPLNQAPQWIRAAETRAILGKEIGILLPRQQSAQDKLAECAIALGNDNQLHPPENLWVADQATVNLFKSLGVQKPFLAPSNPEAIEQLVPEFDTDAAITALEQLPATTLEATWKQNPKLLPQLIQWFEDRKATLRSNLTLRDRLSRLAIFPSGGKLQQLVGLAVPGGFEDPLHLAALVDIQEIGGHRDFLRELGAEELNFKNYAREHIPKALQNPKLTTESCQELVCLLATHIGEIRDDKAIQLALARCPLIKCRDNVFRTASAVYFGSESIVSILGNQQPIAVLPENCREVVRELFLWLGVADKPRPADLLKRIQTLVTRLPQGDVRKLIQNIFAHLSERWQREGEYLDPKLRELKVISWLPAKGDDTKWYRPSEIFNEFRLYLFETQAQFLDINYSVQANATEFIIKFLDIKTEPTLQQVINHLVKCSHIKTEVNRATYQFLKENVGKIDDSNLHRLRDTACLLLGNGRYIRPKQAFWNEHPFGRYRFRLSQDLRDYSTLFHKLGVRESPEPNDAIRILQEISGEFSNPRRQLDDEAQAVVLKCWEFLAQALENMKITDAQIKHFHNKQVIPDQSRFLSYPGGTFFADRPKLAEKFARFLRDNIIPRTPGWQAMQVVGVRPLSQAVQTELLECANPVEDKQLRNRLKDRKPLIARVVQNPQSASSQGWNLDVLNRIIVKQVARLEVRYRLEAYYRVESTEPEPVPVYFDKNKCILYYQKQNGIMPWADLSRELAYALNPDAEGGQPNTAPALKAVLSHDFHEEAVRELDAYGFPALEEIEEIHISQSDPVGLVGNTNAGITDSSTSSETLISNSSNPETRIPDEGEKPNNSTVQQLPNRFSQKSGSSSEDSLNQTANNSTSNTSPKKLPAQVSGGSGNPTATLLTQNLGSEQPNKPNSSTGQQPSSSSGQGSGGTEKQSAGSKEEQGSTYKPRTPQSRVRTVVYLSGSDTAAESAPEEQYSEDERLQIAQCGVVWVLLYEEEQGRVPVEMPQTHPGYDIESKNQFGEVERYIEVKSCRGDWGKAGVKLTSTQFKKAQELGKQYWLYVVERAERDDFKVIRIQNPANQVQEFRYDDGWRSLAEEIDWE